MSTKKVAGSIRPGVIASGLLALASCECGVNPIVPRRNTRRRARFGLAGSIGALGLLRGSFRGIAEFPRAWMHGRAQIDVDAHCQAFPGLAELSQFEEKIE